MEALVLSLDSVRLEDAPRTGRKAAVLGGLRAYGFSVPGGLVLAADAFRLALEPYRARLLDALSGLHADAPGEAIRASGAALRILEGLAVPALVLDVLLPAVQNLAVPLAVRSSAVLEDLPAASFAGQYTSVLGVLDQDGLCDAVLACWKSYFAPGALQARAACCDEDFGLALLIQPLLEAECSGVCYTRDPLRPTTDRVLVNAAWGLGPGVVDGSVAADTTWVSRIFMEVVERAVARKQEQVVLDPRGGLHVEPVPAERQPAACLPDAWAVRVAQACLAAEALLGAPQDVEWAIASGRLWLLQSRPVPGLSAGSAPFPVTWEDETDRTRPWYHVARLEQEREVMPPLARDTVRLEEEMRRDICRWLGAERDEKVRFINGWQYSSPQPLDLSPSDIRLRKAVQAGLHERLYRQGQTNWDFYGPEIVATTGRLSDFDPSGATGADLAGHLEDALAAHRRGSSLHPFIQIRPPRAYVEDFAAFSGMSDPGTEAWPQVEAGAYRLLESDGSVLTRMIDALWELAQAARAVPGLVDLLAHPGDDSLAQIAALDGCTAFLQQFHAFIALYGDRNGDGYGSSATLMTPTWREQPAEVLRLAAAYLDPSLPSPQEARRRARAARDAEVDELCRRADPAETREFRACLENACRFAVALEEHNHYIDQLSLGQLRRAVLLAADRLVQTGAITSPADVFWLTYAEILAGLRAEQLLSYASLIEARRAEHARWEALDPPPLLGLPDFHLPERPPFQDDTQVEPSADPEAVGSTVMGKGASTGMVQGRAVLALDPTRVPEVRPGEILVAVNAGPLWTSIFWLLGGVVLDRGSLGQHAAATAREYGIPAVIETGSATQRITTGDWLTVDGTNGQVEIGPREPSS